MTSFVFPKELRRSSLADKADWLLEWIAKHQHDVKAHSRLPQLCRSVTQSAGRVVSPDDARYAEIVQSEKDLNEWWFIASVLDTALFDEPFSKKFRLSQGDSALARDSGDQTPGRDHQFELLLAATARRAGLAVEDFGPGCADWRIGSPACSWSVEAKRIKSSAQMPKRISEAADQIQNSGCGGIIVLDVTVAANQHEPVLVKSLSDEQLHDLQRQRIRDFWNEDNKRIIRECIGKAPVGALVIHDFIVNPAAETPEGCVSRRPVGLWDWIFLIHPESANRQRYEVLRDLLAASLPNF